MHRLLLLTAALIAPPAFAQDAPIVVTATRAPQAASQTGQAITIITRETLDARQTVSVADLLATTPGVTVSRNGGVGGFTGLRIRGAEAEQTLVLIDGVRLNDPSSPGGGFDFGNLLADNIERIEVLRGPNSVPWGSQAIGGVVNIVTRQPTDRPSLSGHAEYGYADTGQAVGNAGTVFGPVKASIGGGYFRTDGVSSAATGVERDGYERYAANGRIEVALTDRIAVDLRGYYSHGRTEIDGFAPDFSFVDTPEYSTIRELLGYAGLSATLLEGRFVNRAAFTITDIDRDNFDPRFGGDPSFIGRGRIERFEYGGDLKLSDQLRAVFGAESETSRYGDGFARYSTEIDSIYGQLIVKPVAALTLTGGARYDDHKDFGSETTFGGNAALDLGSTLIRASYAEGFKAPTLFQLRSDFGNETLQPERARSFDIGLEQRLVGDRLTASATLFRRKTRDQIDYIFPAPDPIARPSGTYANIARASTSGAEVSLALRPIEALTVDASFTYVDAENRSPDSANFGNYLARRPRTNVSLSADYAPDDGLSLGATIRAVGDSFDDAANMVRLDGYQLIDIRAAWTFDPRFELYGRVENLFDARYRTVATYGTLGRAASVGVRARL